MTPEKLRKVISTLFEKGPLTEELNKALKIEKVDGRSNYPHQKAHWLGWLTEVRGAGYYGLKKPHTSAKSVYNTLMCPPMIFWLAEAVGISKATLNVAIVAAKKAKPVFPSQCGAIRKIVTWEMVEVQILSKHWLQNGSKKTPHKIHIQDRARLSKKAFLP